MRNPVLLVIAVLLIASPAWAGEKSWNELGTELAATVDAGAAPDAKDVPAGEHAAREGCCDQVTPPLPFHSIEGYSGGSITTMAYICNRGCKHTTVGMPAVSYSYMDLGSKNVHIVAITQTFFSRIELGYAMNHLNMGSLYDDIRKAGLDPGRDDVWLHHFNIRGMLLDENSFGLPTPAVTAGVHIKYNDGIRQVNRNLGGALSAIGYDRHYGVDYTLTASKMFPKLIFGRPVILTGGVRFSRSAQWGYLGFGKQCNTTFEGSVVYMPTDTLVLGYEFRGKENPYNEIPGLLGPEHNWHAFSASMIVNEHLTVSALFGMLGNVANARADCTLGVQVKYEF